MSQWAREPRSQEMEPAMSQWARKLEPGSQRGASQRGPWSQETSKVLEARKPARCRGARKPARGQEPWSQETEASNKPMGQGARKLELGSQRGQGARKLEPGSKKGAREAGNWSQEARGVPASRGPGSQETSKVL